MAASTRSKKTGKNLPFSSKMADICLQIKCREQRDYPPWTHWPLKITSEEQHLSRANKIYVAAWCCSTEVRQYVSNVHVWLCM